LRVLNPLARRSMRWLLPCAFVVIAACGSESPGRPSPAPPAAPPAQTQAYPVSSITDGDTLRFSPALSGSTALRMLNIDAPEAAQAPWGTAARADLEQLAPPGVEIAIETDQTRLDAFDRVLGHAIRRDGINVNVEQVRRGQAVLYVIWPNVSRFTEYRDAQIEARTARRGIWDPASPLRELPFEYRLRIDGDAPFRPVGDFLTRMFVEAADYTRVDVNNRVFFNNRTDAVAAGYTACPRDADGYSSTCFGPAGAATFSLLSPPR
jgi:endonuclease YncB( thermonuclease family)